jgi:hypothetical protein
MGAQNGTLRLVAGNSEESRPTGVGATVSDAYATLQKSLQDLVALANQLQMSNPALTNQVAVVQQAVNDWTAAIQTAASASLQKAQTEINDLFANNTALSNAITALKAQLQAAGITPNPGGSTTTQLPIPPAYTPPITTTTPATTPAAGGFTAGQTTAVGVVGLVMGWFGNEMYRGKR